MNGELGLSLIILGIGVAVIGLLVIDSTPLMILGVSTALVGLLANWGEGVLQETELRLSSSSWDNLALLLESVGTASRAIYLPSSMVEDSKPYALIPQWGDVKLSGIVPRGFMVKYGPGPGDVGIKVRSMGSRAVEECLSVGSVSSDLNSTLSNCIVNHLSLAKGVEATFTGDSVVVLVNRPRLINPYDGTIVNTVLGSPMASIVASLVAESLGRPVVIDGEEARGNAILINLRPLTTQ
ncbi:hypothetical protein [Caldivirga maquilingensis]|uniref:hypothetical protein n=1 Tax=Caldivirga maquilingensis TaxID=76887 RepID=UPI00064E2A3E|nr:hypothetical protein [Caldivirga maquilingensis]